jgi:hypothetical protein
MTAFQNAFHSKTYQNNVFFFKKKLFLTSAHQNDLKTPKNINLKQRKKIKKFQIFSKAFLKRKNKQGKC